MPQFETRLWSNSPRYKPSGGAVCIYVHPTQEDAQRQADEINGRDQKHDPHPLSATVHETTFDLVCRVERSTFSTGVRVWLRAPSTLSQRSALTRMAHAARRDMGGRVARVSGPGASFSEGGLVCEWQAFYNYRRTN